eukprot:gene14342-20335_t
MVTSLMVTEGVNLVTCAECQILSCTYGRYGELPLICLLAGPKKPTCGPSGTGFARLAYDHFSWELDMRKKRRIFIIMIASESRSRGTASLARAWGCGEMKFKPRSRYTSGS